MKKYTYKEMQEFITSVLNQPDSGKIVYCHTRNDSNKNLRKFIIIEEEMSFEQPWHDGPKHLQPGCYLHASCSDIYAISADVFKMCFTEVPSPETVS